jgi:thiamine biosynthesis lipoprotein
MNKFLYPILVSFIFIGCNSNKKSLIKVEGNAQGTTYHISYISDDGISHKTSIDSLLKEIDSSMSSWLPVSIISRINNNDNNVLVDKYFIGEFLGIWIYKKSNSGPQQN